MDLAVHFNKKHDRVNNRPQCPVCPKSFSQISHLKNHVNVTHLKRFQGQKKRPPKSIGTVVFKSNHQIRFYKREHDMCKKDLAVEHILKVC